MIRSMNILNYLKRNNKGVIIRTALCALSVLFVLLWIYPGSAAPEERAHGVEEKLAALETDSGGRLGVYAVNTADGACVSWRADERFPLCSTFKVALVAAVLERSSLQKGLMDKRVPYKKSELVFWSPITEKNAGKGMSVRDLCAAALRYSDNTASNLLLKLIGGPQAVTAFARKIGDEHFRLDRWETPLNSAIPGDERDTTTPAAMAATLRKLVVGDALPRSERDQMQTWMKGNTTGDQSIRAGTPKGWTVADKTGSGYYGTTNDVAVIWPPGNASPIVVAIYFTQSKKDAPARKDVLAAAARIITGHFRAFCE